MHSKDLLRLTRYCVITFPNTHSAIMAETTLNSANLVVGFVLMPVPTSISSGCGLAIKSDPEDYGQLVELLGEHSVQINGVHLVDKATDSVTRLS